VVLALLGRDLDGGRTSDPVAVGPAEGDAR
jgi:hypothetical protein